MGLDILEAGQAAGGVASAMDGATFGDSAIALTQRKSISLNERCGLDDVVYDRFSSRVAEALGFYVYRLVDPRDGETFYVGRGVGNRVFDHMDDAERERGGRERSPKTDRIRAIHDAGQKVVTVIHRHGLRDDAETAAVEAVLIEAYPNLTNKVAGAGTSRFGVRTTQAAIESYDDPPANFDKYKCVTLSITPRWPEFETDEPSSWAAIYALSRHGWSLDLKRAERAEWAVIHARGIVRAVFKIDAWAPMSDPLFAAFPGRKRDGAVGFIAAPAQWFVWDNWVGRRVPSAYRTRFGQRVRYANI
ncbi:MAG: hypothetical protein AAF909_02850 [Pseudomonadota bacterium]